jgi:Fic family protein
MLYATPEPSRPLVAQLRELDEMRGRLGDATGVPGPWLGQLRRQARAETVGSSVSIEGFSVGGAQEAALAVGDAQPDPADEDQRAVADYGRAMDHVGTLAGDPHFAWSERVIKDLHFDACWFQRDRSPGLWREGPISVTGFGRDAPPAYVGPDAEDVPGLMKEVVVWLDGGDGDGDAHVAVRAAMAHLHVVSVHPFRDGNGRISRIVQSLVLARDGLLAPEFGSIEEHLARHTSDYYRVLQQVQGGGYQPERDAAPWVRFCIGAHVEQARRRLDQVATATARWAALERLVDERGWPDRLAVALEQALFDGVDRAGYAREADVSLPTATNDLRRLIDAGLVVSEGQTRNRRYRASEALRQALSAG